MQGRASNRESFLKEILLRTGDAEVQQGESPTSSAPMYMLPRPLTSGSAFERATAYEDETLVP